MSIYLEKIIVPNQEKEEDFLNSLPPWDKTGEMYPFGLLTYRKMMDGKLLSRELSEIDFEKVTIDFFYKHKDLFLK